MHGRTIASIRTCLLLPQHRRYVGGKLNQCCIANVLPSLAEPFGRRDLNKNFDLTGSDEVLIATRIPIETMDGIVARKSRFLGCAQDACASANVSTHILYFQSMCYKGKGCLKNNVIFRYHN